MIRVQAWDRHDKLPPDKWKEDECPESQEMCQKNKNKKKLNCVFEIKLKQSTQSFIKSGIYVTNLTLKEFLTHEWNMLSLIFLLASAR